MWGVRGDCPGGLQAGHSGHGDVEQDEVDAAGQGQGYRFDAVAGFGDDVKAGAVVEDEPNPAPDQGVVIGEQDAGVRSSTGSG